MGFNNCALDFCSATRSGREKTEKNGAKNEKNEPTNIQIILDNTSYAIFDLLVKYCLFNFVSSIKYFICKNNYQE